MAAFIAVVTIVLVVVLWWAGTAGLSGAALVTARFDALRTGLSIGIGGGGIFALYLAWRRQHATEIGLVQKERDQADVALAYELQRETAEHTRQHVERVAATTERDAEARRITDLYAKSVEQLGSDKAPVRHGGLYALERLAQDHPDNRALRQTVVNVLCAYLRAPFDLPGDQPDANALAEIRDEYRGRVQEREVRLTAQRILTTHLDPGDDADHPSTTFWSDADLDLTAAVLIDWDMNRGRPHNAIFRDAVFIGDTRFTNASITGRASFVDATFAAGARFENAKFAETARFDNSKFTWIARFDDVAFAKMACFGRATFTEGSFFERASFSDYALFPQTSFGKQTWFNYATFTEYATFENALFTEGARFEDAAFATGVGFNNATFAMHAWFNRAKFHGDAEFHNARFSEGAPFGELRSTAAAELGAALGSIFGDATFVENILPDEANIADAATSERLQFTQGVRFDEATFTKSARFNGATFLHSPIEPSINCSSWPADWQPSPDHAPIEGREGSWHYLLNSEPM
ncbi:pentapeptide repeat-containing protein [Lentzea sp. BCCO 10_0856]|uniref:Pentapeptide repeat-containing protein n=1 Tax=Lentzea miocenica TaxID=3095431 RepID=A0ABU4TDQ6_9PSEU|nr:pentapeptide repeat-containing protein [Lentzea sp. BCCO 10_0856]MDX8036320.1 pentapeptide repeat-containing protein [Lentzea sp. BCCO 10_0856]